MNRLKRKVIYSGFILCLLFCTMSSIHATNTTWEGTLLGEVFDYGTDITKIIFKTDRIFHEQDITKETFRVQATEYSTDPNSLDQVVYDGERQIIDVYPASNEKGTKATKGSFIVIELQHGYQVPGASILQYSSSLNHLLRYEYQVSIQKPFSIDGIMNDDTTIQMIVNGISIPSIDSYSFEKSSSDIQYRQFTPKEKEDKPLIIWFHGGADGGNDNQIQLLSSKSASSLASKEIQDIFGGAYVVIPQAPTFWSKTNIYDDSIYKEQMITTIDEIIKKNSGIDKERIYVGGTSAGGFMAWQMLVENPTMYAAAFLASPAYIPNEEDIKAVQDIPIWILHSEDDSVIPIDQVDKSVKALEKSNKNIIYTKYQEVVIGNQKYDGHFTFIPVFDNLPTTKNAVTIMEWISEQQKVEEQEGFIKVINFVIPIIVITVATSLWQKKKKKMYKGK